MTPTSLGFPIETVLVFAILAIGAIFIDLFMHKSNKAIPLKDAVLWSIFWVVVSFIFATFLYFRHGAEVANLFITGYALEKVLSVDNLFVIMAIFSWFAVPDGYRHRVLYWGIIGAIVFRMIFVVIGTGLFLLGPWVEMVFSVIVAWTGYMMLKNRDKKDLVEDYSQHIAYKAVKKFFPLWPKLRGNSFVLTQKEVDIELEKPENAAITVGRNCKNLIYVTPLMLCLVIVELTDVMFAFDSVPAVIAVSREPLIVYSAMIFAILGLRTLYFVLEAMKQYLVHLEKAVILLLFFIALKLALNSSSHIWPHDYTISSTASLFVVIIVLIIGIFASVLFPKKESK